MFDYLATLPMPEFILLMLALALIFLTGIHMGQTLIGGGRKKETPLASKAYQARRRRRAATRAAYRRLLMATQLKGRKVNR